VTQSGQAPDDGVRERQLQIASDLRALILSGDLPAGERVPSTDALKTRYNVSDKTVQRALQILKDERFVEGQKGRGVFVTANQPSVVRSSHYPRPAGEGQSYPWITDAASRGRIGTTQLLAVEEVSAPAQVAAAYGLERDQTVVMRKQLLLLDGEPAELVKLYYRTDLARGTALAENRKIKGGTPAVLAELGYPLRNAVDQVGTRLASVEEFTALRLPQTMPILRQFRVVYSDNERVVEVAVLVKAGQSYELQYELPASHT
jgi:GntR family transcriptional regulator